MLREVPVPERKQQKPGESCIISSFMICTTQTRCSVDKIKRVVAGGARIMEREKKNVYIILVWKPEVN